MDDVDQAESARHDARGSARHTTPAPLGDLRRQSPPDSWVGPLVAELSCLCVIEDVAKRA